MKHIAAAIIVASGCLLWGVATLSNTWVYAVKGNRHASELAALGGVAVIVIGVGALAAAYRSND